MSEKAIVRIGPQRLQKKKNQFQGRCSHGVWQVHSKLYNFGEMWKETVVVHTTVGSLLFSSAEHKQASHNRQDPASVPSATALCAHRTQSSAVRRGPKLCVTVIIWGSRNPSSKVPQATGVRFFVQ